MPPPPLWLEQLPRRPAAVLCGAIVALAIAVSMAAYVPRAYREAQAVREHRYCSAEVAPPCLEVLFGELRGPSYRRRTPDRWSITPEDDPERDLGDFGLPGADIDRMDVRYVRATVVRRTVVTVDVPGYRILPTDEYGDSHWWRLALEAFTIFGLSLFAAAVAASRRRQLGSWWTARSRKDTSEPGLWATVAAVPGSVGLIALMPSIYGSSARTSAITGAVALGLATLLVGAALRRRRRAAGAHALP